MLAYVPVQTTVSEVLPYVDVVPSSDLVNPVRVYRALGFVFLGLGALGVVLPVLPATPFVLLAAACFAKSSEKWHRWLLANRTFGPMVKNWEDNRCIGCRVKLLAVASMVLVGGFSIFYSLDSHALRITGGVLVIIGLLTIGFLRTCDKEA